MLLLQSLQYTTQAVQWEAEIAKKNVTLSGKIFASIFSTCRAINREKRFYCIFFGCKIFIIRACKIQIFQIYVSGQEFFFLPRLWIASVTSLRLEMLDKITVKSNVEPSNVTKILKSSVEPAESLSSCLQKRTARTSKDCEVNNVT